jgi:NADPH-dependent 2,4-dienoyl-CoA reductase/sulfur reductase-like enzyme
MATDDGYDVVVIGAGPAGMSAAATTARHGLSTALIDEQPALGGQIYRAVASTPVVARQVLGDDYWRGLSLVESARHAAISHLPLTMVWGVFAMPPASVPEGPRWQLAISCMGKARLVHARHIIVATGAQERPFPVPGWTLPGVLTAGAAQILLKTSALAPRGRVVLAGSGPLLLLVAAQLSRVGAGVSCVLDTTLAERPVPWRLLPEFLSSSYAWKGAKLYREARAAARVIRDVDDIAALEVDGRLGGVRYRARGRTELVEADLLLLHQGVVPNINLTMALGCAHHWNEAQACFAPIVDEWGASSVSGIDIAGDGAGIGGARVAEAQGAIAALRACHLLGRLSDSERDAAASAPRRLSHRWQRGRAFIDAMYLPPPQWRAPRGSTIVCRCEEVTAQQVIDSVRMGCPGPNQMKSFLRCGMGPCQGRLCGLTITEIIARERQVTPAQIGYYRTRFPIKPLTLGELASLPKSPASWQAVERLSPDQAP